MSSPILRLYSKEFLKKFRKLVDNALFFRSSFTAKTGNRRHNFIKICPMVFNAPSRKAFSRNRFVSSGFTPFYSNISSSSFFFARSTNSRHSSSTSDTSLIPEIKVFNQRLFTTKLGLASTARRIETSTSWSSQWVLWYF